MALTPTDILSLALTRHRLPWNWTAHFAALGVFAFTLLLHSYILLAVTLACFGAGFFELGLPDMKEGRWKRFVTRMVEWEKNWIAAPWNRGKWWRFLFVLMVAAVTVWALWTGNPPLLALLVAFAYLARVVKENKEAGVDP